MKNIFKKHYSNVAFAIILSLGTSCKKMIEIKPPVDKITGQTVYNNLSTSVAAINGIYAQMVNEISGRVPELSVLPDELVPMAPDPVLLNYDVYTNNYIRYFDLQKSYWASFYKIFIYRANSLIEGVKLSQGLTPNQKKILVSEAKFIRAFSYFYLLNLYGDVPLVISTDLKTNESIPRTTTEIVYQQIISDLIEAEENLTQNYLSPDLLTPTIDRVRPNKYAAAALLARVYLFHEEWDKAEAEATKVINNTAYFELLQNLDQVFLKNSRETIWALQPNYQSGDGQSNNTLEGGTFIPSSSLLKYYVCDSLYQSFEANDKRKANWLAVYEDSSVIPSIKRYYPFKYKVGSNVTGGAQEQTEYSIVLRLAEQYLIRAEARAHSNNSVGAIEDLNIIRGRAGLEPAQALSQTELLSSIIKARRIEFFSEYGMRWFDLKRLRKIDEVMANFAPLKGGSTWASYKALLPIPLSEFINNPSLRGHQNPGYPETF